jgi:ABC-type ATPase with predicted acetyltransferase domain
MAVYTINQKFQAAPPQRPGQPPSDRMVQVAEMFGIGLDASYEVTLYDDLALDVRGGDVVFVTGPSGSGKTVLLERLERAVRDGQPDGGHAVNLAAVRVPTDAPVIDLLAGPLEEALRLLSAAGLADAFLLLRRARELSDGQRYRLRLALALDALLARRGGKPTLQVLVADEFCSRLDRLCARAVAYRVRRLADRHGLTILAASAHDDLVEDLAPDVLIVKHAGDRVEVHYADPARGEVTP